MSCPHVIHLVEHGHAVTLLGPQHVVVLLAGGEPVEVDVHVPAGAEHRVLVDPDHAEVVSVLPQDLQLSHVRLVQLALRVLDLMTSLVRRVIVAQLSKPSRS